MDSRTPLLHESETSSLRPSTTSSVLAIRRSRNSTRYITFVSANLSCLCAGSILCYSLYGHLFQSRLDYTQLQVNMVIIAAELALYLPVSLFGYLCDRIGPAPLSFISGVLFAVGYLLAAFTYRSGASDISGYTHERGWPIQVMIVAFVIIGAATTLMYISAVTACAKNFGRGKHRGLALACPIAAFGLSSLWQSQVGSRLLYERLEGGQKGDVDVFRFFVFLAATLFSVGVIGTFLLRVVDEEGLIDEAVEELERSGLLEDSAFFNRGRTYGATLAPENMDEEERRVQEAKDREDEEARKKTWLLNEETSRFLKDHTMWWLAGGFLLVSGPGEAFITNLGTIIGTLYPPSFDPLLIPTSAATHVSIVAITSTIARILFGTLTDFLAPSTTSPINQHLSDSLTSLPPRQPTSFTISRISFLIFSALLISFGQVILASGFVQNHAERFWLVSGLIGSGYGALFSLTPLIITVIWGVENFGTNWGIVAMVPALGATLWGLVYSSVYQWAADNSSGSKTVSDVLCYGRACYEGTFWAMAISVWVGCAFWIWAWKGRNGWSMRGIMV